LGDHSKKGEEKGKGRLKEGKREETWASLDVGSSPSDAPRARGEGEKGKKKKKKKNKKKEIKKKKKKKNPPPPKKKKKNPKKKKKKKKPGKCPPPPTKQKKKKKKIDREEKRKKTGGPACARPWTSEILLPQWIRIKGKKREKEKEGDTAISPGDKRHAGGRNWEKKKKRKKKR